MTRTRQGLSRSELESGTHGSGIGTQVMFQQILHPAKCVSLLNKPKDLIFSESNSSLTVWYCKGFS